MIPLSLSVVFGLGIYLAYEGLTRPLPPKPESRRLRRVEEFLVRAGLRDVTPRGFILFSVGSGLLTGLLAQLFLGWGLVSLVALPIGAVVPFVYYVHRHDHRRALVQAALVESISQLHDSIRAGFAVQEALINLAHSGPVTLRREFAILAREMRLLGFEPALTGFRDRLADPVFDVVCASLILNDRLGGRNVSQVLDHLAHATREQLRIAQELRAYQARNVLSARIVAAVPLVVLIGIRQVNPRYLAVFDTVWGQMVLAGCLLSIVVGYAAMVWTTRLPGERRVLQ